MPSGYVTGHVVSGVVVDLSLSPGMVLHIGFTSLLLSPLDRIVQKKKILRRSPLSPIKIYYFVFISCMFSSFDL